MLRDWPVELADIGELEVELVDFGEPEVELVDVGEPEAELVDVGELGVGLVDGVDVLGVLINEVPEGVSVIAVRTTCNVNAGS